MSGILIAHLDESPVSDGGVFLERRDEKCVVLIINHGRGPCLTMGGSHAPPPGHLSGGGNGALRRNSCLRVWKQPFIQFHDKPGRYCREIRWDHVDPIIAIDAISFPGCADKV
jgi:hypothetical protein